MSSFAEKLLGLSPKLSSFVFRHAERLAFVRERLEREYQRVLEPLNAELHPYRASFRNFADLPEHGLGREATLALVRELSEGERRRADEGYLSGAVYHGGSEHVALLNQVYALTSQVNPLHADVWPSSIKFEAEIVAMTKSLFCGQDVQLAKGIVGTVTSGGSESILLAMKAYRDRARQERGIERARIVAPTTAHVAFHKAAELLGMELVSVPVDSAFRADTAALARALTRDSVVLVGSAPSFPHGVIDPIEELAGLALERNLGLHVDACLGGFILPWAERLGWPVPPFDFRLPGVSSLSADTHKYGYAPKGTSVVLYRDAKLRRFQYFVSTDWPGGLYFSPTLAGSRPGGLSAACWASLVSTGQDGYRRAAERILATAAEIRRGIPEIPGLELFGESLFVVAFGSRELDIYRVLDRMSARGWSLNGLQRPACLHLCVTLPHTQEGVRERFLEDLRASVAEARSTAASPQGLAPIYGRAGSFPVRGAVRELIERYVDRLYEP